MDQVVVRVVLAVAVPFKDPEGNFSALLDTVEVDIAVDRVEELKSLVKEFDVNG